MHILQVLHNHKFGGAEQHLLQLCVGLREAGHTVEAVAPARAWIGQRLQEVGFTVHDFDFRGHYDMVGLLRLVGLLRRRRYDLMHTHLVRAARYGHLAARWTGTPLVCSVHDLTTWQRYPHQRRLIAVSDAVKRHLESRGFRPENIEVIFPGARDCSLGVDSAAARRRVRAELGIAEHEQAIVLIGRVAEVKGDDIALESVRILHEQGHTQVRLLFAGQDTDWGTALRTGEQGRYATWLGRRDDIPQLLAAADICIQPSRSEGLGMALMEAASAGKALVATRVGGIPEVIEHGHSGWLVPPDDAAALAQAILTLLRHPEMALQMGTRARQRFDAAFSIANMVTHTLGVYRTMLRPCRTPHASSAESGGASD